MSKLINVIFLKERIYQYLLLTRFHRPIGILLLLWPTLWALWFAGNGKPQPFLIVIFILGTALMRAAGCAINDYADRNFDPFVERTKDRPVANGKVTPREALGVFTVLALLSFALVLLTNPLTIKLSIIGVILAASYPFTKRYTNLPQFYLGLAFGWAIPMAFAASTGDVPNLAWIIFFSALLWAVAYDTLYAMVDREDDLKIGVKSTAILFGHYDKLAVLIAHILTIGLLVIAGHQTGRNYLYFLGLTIAAGLAIYQQWLIKNREPRACFKAFLNNHWFGMFIFIGLLLDYFFQH